MSNTAEIVASVLKNKIIAIIRAEDSLLEHLPRALPAMERGGLKLIEVTITTPDALKTISWAVKNKSAETKFGAGTITNVDEAQSAIDVGAEFLVCPTLSTEVIEFGIKKDVPVLPGCLTPTEVLTAHQVGAELVKLFPCSAFGPNYIKDLLGPLTKAKLIAVGGVELANMKEFFSAGAVAVGIGKSLVSGKLVREATEAEIEKRVREFVDQI
jgi:2-dehydro-3-deoxyphosphogluconate aldolase/(4S)-4-hydroxy-2-oxoglutarate aldolase